MIAHPADADYLDQNLPNEAELDAMMESALALADVMQGRRRVDAEGRGVPLRVAIDDGFDPPVVVLDRQEMVISREGTVMRPHRPGFNPDAMREALASAGSGSGDLSAGDRVVIQGVMLKIQDYTRQLRDLGIGDPVFGHALNTLDLGVVGLARVAGKEGNGA